MRYMRYMKSIGKQFHTVVQGWIIDVFKPKYSDEEREREKYYKEIINYDSV